MSRETGDRYLLIELLNKVSTLAQVRKLTKSTVVFRTALGLQIGNTGASVITFVHLGRAGLCKTPLAS